MAEWHFQPRRTSSKKRAPVPCAGKEALERAPLVEEFVREVIHESARERRGGNASYRLNENDAAAEDESPDDGEGYRRPGSRAQDDARPLPAEYSKGLPEVDQEFPVALRMGDEMGLIAHIFRQVDALIDYVEMPVAFVRAPNAADFGQMAAARRNDAYFHDGADADGACVRIRP